MRNRTITRINDMKLVSSICFAIFALFLNACSGISNSGSPNSVSVVTYEDSVKIIPSKTEPRELKDGYAYGKIEQCVHNDLLTVVLESL